MLKNYFITAFRKMGKQKLFSLINILGLAIGISASLVIYLVVNYDFNFDKFATDRERIYRVVSDFTFSGREFPNPGVPGPLPETVKKEITGVEEVIPVQQAEFDITVTIPSGNPGKPVAFKKQPAIVFADQSYFMLIPFKWLAGSAQSSIMQPGQVVLTRERAKLYFPLLQAEKVLGKEIVYNDSIRARVSGVVEDFDMNTDLIYKEFISRTTVTQTSLRDDFGLDEWHGTSGSCQLFIKLTKRSTAVSVEKQLSGLLQKYRPDQKQTSQDAYILSLQPLSDVHFNKAYGGVASKPVLYGLLAVGLFLLLLGCVNFINLSTAQATQRAKETGIRKTLGSSKTQLRIQFLSETFIITCTAAVLSVLFVPVLLKIFAGVIPQGFHFDIWKNLSVIFFVIELVILVTVLSGYYPAMVLSRFNPVQVLKGQSSVATGRRHGTSIRKFLTVSQFVIAQVFIMATLIVSKQIYYSLNKDLGFNKDAVVFFNTSFNEKQQHNKFVLRNKLQSIPGVKMISMANNPPSAEWQRSGSWHYKDGIKEIETNAEMKLADTNYLALYNIRLLAGSNFKQSDTINQVVINQTYAHILGFNNPGQAIGKILVWNNKNIPVVGVIADFHDKSLHQLIHPLLIGNRASEEICVNILLQPQVPGTAGWKTTISKIEATYHELYPDEDFDYSFFDQSIAKMYKKEQDISQLLQWATGLAVFISCLGLLGLVIYSTNVRVKEIGVRKVLGASVMQIVSILSADFIKLVMIGFIVAVPIAWWGTHTWLQNFSYRTEISWWLFAIAGISMILIALFTITYQTIRAAIANPVKSLRTE